MHIELISDGKERFMDLLLIADESETMIEKYLDRGSLFALYDDGLKSIAVVTNEESGVYEIKNIATYEKYQNQGYASALMNYIFDYYKSSCKTMLVGTGESPGILSFYESFGFIFSHRVPNFFIDNYSHPMFEGNRQLIDMIYLKKSF